MNRTWIRSFLVVPMIALSSCAGGGSSPAGQSAPDSVQIAAKPIIVDTTAQVALPGVTPPVASPTHPQPAVPAPVSELSAGQFHWYCGKFAGVDHVSRSMRLKQQLIEQTPLKNWQLVHGTDDSRIYYGAYAAIDTSVTDPAMHADAMRAANDRQAVEQLRDKSGTRLFAALIAESTQAADPEAPPEWNLLNADPKMYWTVQESSFTRPDLRKQCAVERVREIRAHGIAAYYYHGPNVSSVCVGLWPKEAVDFADVDQVHVDPRHKDDPNYQIVVDTIGLPEDVTANMMNGQHNTGLIRAVQEVKDPTLLQTTKDFPLFNNYEPMLTDPDEHGLSQSRPGLIVRVPHDEQRHIQQATTPPTSDPNVGLINPDTGPRQGLGGGLRRTQP